MESEVDEVERGRVQTKEVALGHVRKPRKRMPIVEMKCGEGPCEVFRSEPTLNSWIFGEISVVIEGGDEVGVSDLPISANDRGHEDAADCQGQICRSFLHRWINPSGGNPAVEFTHLPRVQNKTEC